MTLFLTLLLLAASSLSAQPEPQAFRLQPGDYRWVPFTIQQTPTEVECVYEVLQGKPSVHLEMLPMSEFRLFDRGRDHASLGRTPVGKGGVLRRTIATRGQYAVVVVNDAVSSGPEATPAIISMQLHMTSGAGSDEPQGQSAQTLPPQRRLIVILLSFAFFFITITWSSRQLIRAMRSSTSSR